jgi:hypothetical protein
METCMAPPRGTSTSASLSFWLGVTWPAADSGRFACWLIMPPPVPWSRVLILVVVLVVVVVRGTLQRLPLPQVSRLVPGLVY